MDWTIKSSRCARVIKIRKDGIRLFSKCTCQRLDSSQNGSPNHAGLSAIDLTPDELFMLLVFVGEFANSNNKTRAVCSSSWIRTEFSLDWTSIQLYSIFRRFLSLRELSILRFRRLPAEESLTSGVLLPWSCLLVTEAVVLPSKAGHVNDGMLTFPDMFYAEQKEASEDCWVRFVPVVQWQDDLFTFVTLIHFVDKVQISLFYTSSFSSSGFEKSYTRWYIVHLLTSHASLSWWLRRDVIESSYVNPCNE